MASTVTPVVVDVPMPKLSDGMEEGTILTWTAADGATVARGQEIVEIETDKAAMAYEAEADGVLRTLAAEGDTVAVGALIARIEPEGAAIPDETAPPVAVAPAAAADPAGAGGAGHEAGSPEPPAPVRPETGARANASPVARRVAGERGVDLAGLTGSGPGGRIVKADVLAATPAAASASPAAPASQAASAPAAAAPGESAVGAKGAVTVVTPTRVQLVVARRMAEAKATAPEFVVEAEIDMTSAVAMRARLKALLAGSETPPPSLNDMVVTAVGRALRGHPKANGAFRDGRFELFERVNVGVAVAGPDTLVVPTVFDADVRSLGAIAADVRRLAAKARDGALTPPELAGGTFSVSNLGMFGIDRFTAVLNPPQAGILAVGAVRERAVVRDGELAVRSTMHVALTCDHRILYGADAARFLARVRELLEQAETLVL